MKIIAQLESSYANKRNIRSMWCQAYV